MGSHADETVDVDVKLLRVLGEIVTDIASQPDSDSCLRRLRGGLLRLGFRRAGVATYDPRNPSVIVGAWGTDWDGAEVDDHGVSIDVTPEMRVYLTGLGDGEPILDRVELPALTNGLPLTGHLVAIGAPNRAIVGLQFGQEMLGSVSVDMLPGAESITSSQVAILRLVAEQAALAVSRGRLVTEIRQSHLVEARYAAIVESSEDAIIGMDLDLTITDWNSGAEKVYGYATREMIGRSVMTIVPSQLRGEMYEIRETLLAGARIPPFETIRRHRDGHLIDMSISMAPIRNANGRIVGIAGIGQDITARKAAEERILWLNRELEERVAARTSDLERAVADLTYEIGERRKAEAALAELYRTADRLRGEGQAVLDSVSEAILLISPDRIVLAANQVFEEFFNVPNETIAGHSFWEYRDLLSQIFVDPHKLAEAVAGSASDYSRQFVYNLIQQWPVRRDLEMYSTPVWSTNREHVGRLFTFRDITREREADRMKSAFVSSVSHELRTPLTSIKGFIDLLIDEGLGGLSNSQRDFLEIVHRNTERLSMLIDDLLDLSRIDRGTVELDRRATNLGDLIQNAGSVLRPEFEAKRQVVRVDLPDNMPLVHADEGRITQVLLNLLSNAHKYTPRDGMIAVSTWFEGGFIRVDVADNGIGLSDEEQSMLFTRFFRANNQATQSVGGTGLGLVISRSLIEQHGGRMWVTSTLGHGATFSFTLPVIAT